MFRIQYRLLSVFVLLSSSLLTACDSWLLCGEHVCVWHHDDCDKTHSCSESRQCEAAGSIRDRAPRIINQLRDAQRSCGGGFSQANNAEASQVVWDEAIASISISHARDMARNRFESFIGSNGLSTSDRVSSAGIESLTVFENITSGPQTSAETINRWLAIPTDCQQLLASEVTRIGMACAVNDFDNNGPYWSLLMVGPEL